MSQSIIDVTKNIEFFRKSGVKLIPSFFWDENFTSIEAEHLGQRGFSKTKKAKKIS